MIYVCKICSYKYDESKESALWNELPDDWVCPVCGVDKNMFELISESAPEKQKESSRTSSDLIIETLVNFGLKEVFGMVGHSNLGISDAIRRREEEGKINFTGIRHEGAAAFACAAYGKLAKKPAACLTISGPGATNILTGLADAKCDSAPALAITGQVESCDMGRYIFQELDLIEIFKPLCEWNGLFMPNSDVAAMAKSAYENAFIKKAVAHLEVLDDVQTMENNGLPLAPTKGFSTPVICGKEAEIAAGAKFILAASKPIIFVGDGAYDEGDCILNLAEYLNCPIITSFRARGCISEAHEYNCGLIGRSGNAVARKFLSESDCILALGAGFSKHSSIPEGKSLVQMDNNPLVFNRLYKCDVPILCDIPSALPLFLQEIKKSPKSANAWGENLKKEIQNEKNSWRETKKSHAEEGGSSAINSAKIGLALSKHIPKDAIICMDVGSVTYWFGRYFESDRQRFLCSWYLGSIGVGLPSAIGAWRATKDPKSAYYKRQVVAIVGDGGLGQYLAEWCTVAKYKMNIKCIVINNSELAKITAEQKQAKFPIWETKLVNPGFAKYARDCGTQGILIGDASELDAQLTKAFSSSEATLVEIVNSL